MIVILLVAAVDTELEREIRAAAAASPQDTLLQERKGLPKSLIPVAGRSMLDRWWDLISTERTISKCFIVTNAAKYKHFERWASERGIPLSHVVNDGVTSRATQLGSAQDLVMALRRARAAFSSSSSSPTASASPPEFSEDVLVVAGDHLFYRTFDLAGTIKFHDSNKKRMPDANLMLYYAMQSHEDASQRGVACIDPATREITKFVEKPSFQVQAEMFGASIKHSLSSSNLAAKPKASGETTASASFSTATAAGATDTTVNTTVVASAVGTRPLGVPMFYIFSGATVNHLIATVAAHGEEPLGCGRLVETLCARDDTHFFGMRLPSAFGITGVDDKYAAFQQLERAFQNSKGSGGGASTSFDALDTVTVKSYARTGLMGNPSDGFHGKTLGVTVSNFWAEVTLTASERIVLHPHPLYDPSHFGSLSDVYKIGSREGYMGGMRLLMATCKKFSEYCTNHGIALPKRNFEVRYDTNIPKQVGLAGSSAIVSALFKCLLKFYGLSNADIPLPVQPSFVLSVEMEELGINAGLQDRVMQIYEGLVYMDFDKELVESTGHGAYRRLDCAKLMSGLPLFIAYESRPSDSGKIHSSVRQRWLNGDAEVLAGVRTFVELTDMALGAIESGDSDKLRECMDANFDMRRKLYGDGCLGAANLEMVQIARNLGAAAKFPGSGGAIVGLAKEADDLFSLRSAYEAAGYVFVKAEPYFPAKEEEEVD